MKDRDPVLRSHVSDMLPDEHPLAWKHVACQRCNVLVHAGNNECMQTWVETGKGPYCLPCFAELTGRVVEDEWGLG
jgi:hypothetical protein